MPKIFFRARARLYRLGKLGVFISGTAYHELINICCAAVGINSDPEPATLTWLYRLE